MDDHLLVHLKLVMIAKLRRGESFTLSWTAPDDEVPYRCTMWVHPAIPFRFDFDSVATPALDRRLLEALMTSSYATEGIVLSSGWGGR